jgi:iron complex transport system substrate-binding protein
VKNNQLHEVKSSEILQPGPAALTDGVRRIHAVLSAWAKA